MFKQNHFTIFLFEPIRLKYAINFFYRYWREIAWTEFFGNSFTVLPFSLSAFPSQNRGPISLSRTEKSHQIRLHNRNISFAPSKVESPEWTTNTFLHEIQSFVRPIFCMIFVIEFAFHHYHDLYGQIQHTCEHNIFFTSSILIGWMR